LAENRVLYSRNASSYFIPASTTKLLTTAAVLSHFSPDYRIRTPLYARGKSPQLTTLRVVGRGDPTLTEKEFHAIANQLFQRGVRRIDTLVADDRYFPGDWNPGSWQWEDVQAGYGAPVTSLIFRENAIKLILSPQNSGQPLEVSWAYPEAAHRWQVDNQTLTGSTQSSEWLQVGRDMGIPKLHLQGQLRAGSASEPVYIAVRQPIKRFLRNFREALTATGISVDTTRIATSPPTTNEREIAAWDSAPLTDLIRETNQKSVNIYAEALLRILGMEKNPEADSALTAGLQALETTLAELGIDPDSYLLADGSGLSRQNLVAPEALVATLEAMHRSPYAQSYRQSLASSDRGTLSHRFAQLPSLIHAKTGYMTGIRALAGYIDNPHYGPIAFSIVANHLPDKGEPQTAIDEIVGLFASVSQRCSSNSPRLK
jgi:D-alanyl-D-alanine carboxypeptidase/D-alanyl-D-alanine-endopeptidase (penicillin-binding protein 4)